MSDIKNVSITQDVLKELVIYDPDSGKFTWRERNEKWFTDYAHSVSWNKRHSGNPAINNKTASGYKMGYLLKQMSYAHRLTFVYMTGNDSKEVDHINGDRSDNRWANLREVNRVSNSRNSSLSKKNKSGFCGVSFIKKKGKWYASIRVDGKTLSLGYYTNIDDAITARKIANIKYGFHKGHGKINAKR